MKGTTKCNNCGNQVAEWTYYTGAYGIEEEYIICSCGYSYEFAYGNYVEKFPGKVAMAWTHDNHEKIPFVEY